MKTALICGISGQDGAYLAQQLLNRGYRVIGTTRSAPDSPMERLSTLKIREKVKIVQLDLLDFTATRTLIEAAGPHEVYNLSGQSSVGRSFSEPVVTFESFATANLHLLEAIRLFNTPIRLFFACSGECFGETLGEAADESSPFHPESPYAAAKVAAHYQIVAYRKAYGVFACSGFLFNHESPLRGEAFFTTKILCAARAAAQTQTPPIRVGNLAVQRDFGWAPEYTDAMWRMLQLEQAEDFVLATGHSVPLHAFVAAAFGHFGLDWAPHIQTDTALFRPTDLQRSCGNPKKAERLLGWQAHTRMPELVSRLLTSGPV